ncbi:unknown similar to AMEV011 [Mythimna separata entomopoxvirus 'L']|uniref:Uncharacterized protein n=1 Tax=Mythimna separata entomopoxvirus 'L' TaxID=1293572 RepID=A0A916KQJ3_9POXV|nr:unknown similar to AMEV011 [Mythimna separata entomopoxvirus 'L']CCU56478.1 unknown similar to AMEV011 [Mythimna separata entomopoxvirus 'L']
MDFKYSYIKNYMILQNKYITTQYNFINDIAEYSIKYIRKSNFISNKIVNKDYTNDEYDCILKKITKLYNIIIELKILFIDYIDNTVNFINDCHSFNNKIKLCYNYNENILEYNELLIYNNFKLIKKINKEFDTIIENFDITLNICILCNNTLNFNNMKNKDKI